MASTLLDLEESIRQYPALGSVLGQQWINEQKDIDPVDSNFAVARWLRIPGYEPELQHLDGILSRLGSRPGMVERRRKLQRDPESFSEVFAELIVIDWILEAAYEIRLPSSGPDISVDLAGSTLPIEVTTPRRLAWKDDVTDRLWILADVEDVAFRIDSESDPNPGDVAPELATRLIVDTARTLAEEIRKFPSGSVLTRAIDDIDCVISIRKDASQPRILFSTTIDAGRRYGAYWYAKEAAKRKAEQFLSGIPNALLVSLDQMADQDFLAFEESLSIEPLEIPIEWDEIPPEVRFLLMCRFRRSQSTPVAGRWIKNPNSPYVDPPGSIELLKTLFPGGPTSQPVQLPPLELDESWFTTG